MDELVYFLNLVNNSIDLSNDKIDTLKKIEAVINEFDINVSYMKELIYILKNTLQSMKKKNISCNLISHDWQLAMIEKENEKTSVSLNKYDKVEVNLQVKTFDNKNQEYKNDMIKMGYNEFYELFQNMKKIDGQLHLFKN